MEIVKELLIYALAKATLSFRNSLGASIKSTDRPMKLDVIELVLLFMTGIFFLYLKLFTHPPF
jgi:hypothetical protein